MEISGGPPKAAAGLQWVDPLRHPCVRLGLGSGLSAAGVNCHTTRRYDAVCDDEGVNEDNNTIVWPRAKSKRI